MNKYNDIIKQVVSQIDPITKNKILNQISTDLGMLISPRISSKKDFRPRPQNCFLIYRRDFMGRKQLKDLYEVSPNAGRSWASESEEVKNIYRYLADKAKQVHELIFPGYIFRPKKKRSSKFSSHFPHFHFPPSPPQSPQSLYPLYYHTGTSSSAAVASGSSSPISNNNNNNSALASIDSVLSNNYDRSVCGLFKGPLFKNYY